MIILGVVVALDILLLVFAALGPIPLALAVSLVGVLTFFGTLGTAAFLSDETALQKNEVRDAIAASFIVVYLVSVGWFVFGGAPVGDPALVGHFTNLVGVLIGFYVGAKVAEVGIKEYKKMSIVNTYVNKKGEAPSEQDLKMMLR